MTEVKKSNLKNAGKKGGTRFPNYSLKQILPFIKEFTSKTHTKPITMEQMNAGVFKMSSKSAEGQVKLSSMKQFGLAEGEYKAIKQTELTGKIGTADEKDLTAYYRTAFLNVPTFKNTYETYQSSTVSKSKLKSYSVSSLKVHPDSSDRFINSLLESAEIAQVCSISGDDITFINAKNISEVTTQNDGHSNKEEEDDNVNAEQEDNFSEDNQQEDDDSFKGDHTSKNKIQSNRIRSTGPSIELKIDPTLDPDKLEKQLKILKKFGLI